MRDKINIVAIDGGGIRGIFTSRLIEEIEEKNNIYFHEYFDDYVGVSTGSIIATLLFFKCSGKEIYEIYRRFSSIIFDKPIKWPFETYSITKLRNNIYNFLVEKFGSTKIKYIGKGRLYISAYNKSRASEEVFEISEGIIDLKDLSNKIAASCAAPTYFDPIKFNSNEYIDGGVVSRNPSILAFSKAMKSIKVKNVENIKILSMGTMYNKSSKNNVILELFDSIMEGVTHSNDNYLSDIYKGSNNYLRIDFESKNKLEIDKMTKELEKDIENIAIYYGSYKNKIKKFLESR